MGQRLNIEIHNNGELLANCYYHWAAYTDSALELATYCIHAWEDLPNEKLNPKQKALWMLNNTGATVPPDQLEAVVNILELDYDTIANRNSGLIAVTEEAMQDTRDWEEGRITIDIGKEIVDFNVMDTCDEDELDEDDVVEDLNYYTREVPFRDWDSFKDDLENISCYFKDLDDDCILVKIQ